MKFTPRLRSLHAETNLVIHGVPRTWLPQDVTNALEEIGATRSGAPTLVTKQPKIFTPLPTAYNTAPPPATASFHITFPSPSALKQACLALPRAGARFLGFPAGPGSAVKKHAGLKFESTGEDAARWVVSLAGKEWMSTEGKRTGTGTGANQQDETSVLDAPTTKSTSKNATNQETLSGYLAAFVAANPAPLALSKRGHQVLLRGLPSTVSEENVRKLGADFKIDDTYGIWRVPKLQADRTSSHIISLPSPSEAHRFVRAVHNRRYGGRQFDREFVMRAEVVS
ncbi:hypothetical protein NliqN6_0451 [Naganishia liquefaciens]|uniref:Uncharacterized protein n=1 Tax=Naganishia liquefaciens TaxID=104408 RepID=A0A8H3TPP1_9TREE|nr:hypothetical protein NliqN6_0451 [Naganishia liquefaciens]